MDEFVRLLDSHTKVEEARFANIEDLLARHIDHDYPEVIKRLGDLEHLLHEINGGMKVLKFIGWSLSALAGVFVFLKDHLFHLGK